MIEKLIGKINVVSPKEIVVDTSSVSFSVNCIPNSFTNEESGFVWIHFHWSSENGPSMFGFREKSFREFFRILIECPKVGPSLGLNILSQIDPIRFCNLILGLDETSLAKINGIGPKTAKNLISFLEEKCRLFLQNYQSTSNKTSDSSELLDLRDALISLGYSNTEINPITQIIFQEHAKQSFDQKLRKALSLLQQ